MRVLIQDYSSPDTTAPMYLCQSFNTVGIQSVLWNSDQSSAYDTFDSFLPNLFIAHFQRITSDCIKYLSQNRHITTILNMTGAQQQHIEQLEGLIRDTNINVGFAFTSSPKEINKLNSSSVKIIDLPAAVDLFAATGEAVAPPYEIDHAVVSNYDARSVLSSKLKGISYHFLSTSSELTDSLDITAPEINLQSLYSRYKNVIVSRNDQVIPQSLFSAVYKGAKVVYSGRYETQASIVMEALQNMYRGVKGCFDMNADFDQQKVREYTIEKHTCFNRTQKICAKLGWTEIKNRFDEKIGELI